jgi:hypothetical protein
MTELSKKRKWEEYLEQAFYTAKESPSGLQILEKFIRTAITEEIQIFKEDNAIN